MHIHTARMYDGRTILSAWEPSAIMGKHSTIRHDDEGRCWGRVGTRFAPESLEAMRPGSVERIAAADAWHAEQYREAYAAIVAAYPEAADGERRSGEITLR